MSKSSRKIKKHSEYNIQSLFDKSSLPIVLLNLEGKILTANPVIEKIAGYKVEEIIGKKFTELPMFPPDQLSEMTRSFRKLINGGIYGCKDVQIYKKDGKTTIWITYLANLITIGEKTLIQVILQNIDQEKQLQKITEDFVKNENKKLKELDKMRKNFLDTAAHELKTPLTSVYSAIQILHEFHNDKFDNEVKILIEIAKNGSEKLKNLILNILDISRMESYKFKLHKKKTDLVKVIKESARDLNYFLEEKNHLIKFDLPEELNINVDRSLIERVITNLVTNAIKYSQPKRTTHISLSKRNKYIEISVRDGGIGLREKEIKLLFKKFSRIERNSIDIIEGTGLGLYISKLIVELHKGKIWAESDGINKGSTFIVRLPLKSQ